MRTIKFTAVLAVAVFAATAAFAEEWSYETPMKVAFSQNKLSVAFRVAGVDQLKAYVERTRKKEEPER